jgi:D-alanine-D-alanine ligase
MAKALHQNVEDALEEYDSPETVEAIASVFRNQGHLVIKLGGGRAFLENILREKVDFVFNISEGSGSYRSREAQLPSVMEMLGIPYTGADPQCLAVCLDKPLTKKLVKLAGVETPGWLEFSSDAGFTAEAVSKLRFPLFIKPSWEGSSKGIRLTSRISNIAQLQESVKSLFASYHQPVMVEEFIPGDEITVGVIGNPPQIVGIMRVLPRRPNPDFVYSLEVKRDWERLVEYECPARLPREVMNRIEESALRAFRELGCRDFARVDFRVSGDGVPFFLEINPLPGLNPHSGDLPIMSRMMGWSYDKLVTTVWNAARSRYN